jgi:hypothetical protein
MQAGMAMSNPPSTTTGPGNPGDAQQDADHGQCHHGTDHGHLAVGEVDQPEDAVDHGVAQCHQGIDAAQHQAVDELLGEDVHIKLAVGSFQSSAKPLFLPTAH